MPIRDGTDIAETARTLIAEHGDEAPTMAANQAARMRKSVATSGAAPTGSAS